MQDKIIKLPSKVRTERGQTPLNNLPIQLTPLIGREQETKMVCALLRRPEVRLLTLTGTGGIGKTRLGLQVATDLLDDFDDGVCFVPLAPISDPDLVMPTIAQTLGLWEVGDRPLLEQLKAYLQDRHLLLLLDNFEQIVVKAPLLTDLLAACPELKILVTSRAVLHIHGEYEFSVPPLAMPDLKHLPELETLSQYAAITLFIQRAQAIKPDFKMTKANAPTTADLCARLEGLPLAIELAAARIKLLPPQTLLARLSHRLRVLKGGARDAPTRQQTLRNTIAWSYNLLDAEEQRLFRQFSVFVGGWTLEAAEAVGKGANNLTMDVLDGVASLIDKSLVQQTAQEGEEPRLAMLETIREYGLEALVDSGEMEITQQAHAEYYLALAEEAEHELEGPNQVAWLERLEREHDNLRAAMRWLLEQEEGGHSNGNGMEMEMTLRLGGALRRFWRARGYFSEARTFLEQALAGSRGVAASVRAKALQAAADVALNQSDFDRGVALCEESLALYREIEDKPGIAFTLRLLGSAAMFRCNYAVARPLMEEALALQREVGDKERVAESLFYLGLLDYIQDEHTRGRALLEEGLALFREIGDKRGISWSLVYLARMLFASQGDQVVVHSLLEEGLALCRELSDKDGIANALSVLGQVSLHQGDATIARSLAEESVVLYKEIGDRWATANSLAVLARVVMVQGDHTAARAFYEESLATARGVGDKLNMASCLEGLASVVAAQGEPTWAARLWGAAEFLREAIGAPIPPVERVDYERSVAAARASLEEKTFAAAWAEGGTMSPEQALVTQRRETMPKIIPAGQLTTLPAKSPPTYPDGLTAREVEVLRLVAQGLTDAQVAEQLVISRRTVNWYLTSIYSKIGVPSRSAATRYAIEQHLA